MRVPSQIGRFFAGSTTLALLAGCSGAGGALAPTAPSSVASGASVASATQSTARPCGSTPLRSQAHHFWSPGAPVHSTRSARAFVDKAALAKTPNTIAVSDAANGVVDVFDPSGTQLAELTGFNTPDGIASDLKGDLYVADSNNDRIAVYAAGLQGSPTFFSEPGSSPSDVDSFRNGEIVAAANFGNGCVFGSVTFFVDGVLKKTITSASLSSAWFLAFDAVGNLYVDGLDGNGDPTVGEIVGGVKGTTFTPLGTANSFGSAVGIQVTTDGRIAIADQAGYIYTYDAPSGGSLGTPTSTTPLGGPTDVVGFAFTKHGANLYGGAPGSSAAEKFRYPAGGTATSSLAISGEAIGIAIVPTQVPKTQ